MKSSCTVRQRIKQTSGILHKPSLAQGFMAQRIGPSLAQGFMAQRIGSSESRVYGSTNLARGSPHCEHSDAPGRMVAKTKTKARTLLGVPRVCKEAVPQVVLEARWREGVLQGFRGDARREKYRDEAQEEQTSLQENEGRQPDEQWAAVAAMVALLPWTASECTTAWSRALQAKLRARSPPHCVNFFNFFYRTHELQELAAKALQRGCRCFDAPCGSASTAEDPREGLLGRARSPPHCVKKLFLLFYRTHACATLHPCA